KDICQIVLFSILKIQNLEINLERKIGVDIMENNLKEIAKLFTSRNIDSTLDILFNKLLFGESESSAKVHAKKMYDLYKTEHHDYGNSIIISIFVQTIIDKKYFYSQYSSDPLIKWSELEKVRKIYLKNGIT